MYEVVIVFFFFFQAEDGIRDIGVTGVQTCALPISSTITLNFIGMMRKYENRNNANNDRNGIEKGVNTIEITRAAFNIVLSAIICSLSTFIGIKHYYDIWFYTLHSAYFLSLATGIFICCLYLATVRRAMG